MIEVVSHTDGVSIKGHARYAPHGQDIVCAAVSALTYTLISSIEELTQDKIKYTMSSGSTDIYHGNLSEASLLLVDSFFIGLEAIAQQYPDNVRVISPRRGRR